ncbi:MFS transporter [Lentzea aerocolonigenes]|uniref:MFS transporter n=1 Tax=Lentzea aerocolonigenes TaxID=68170 RepID=UPI00055F0FAE|nr:MFS transporter [Lentzea aerocolonigenes]MCP2245981.1 putative arabinose efflux permease, MFS family [Lentzea aerocolonigenes]
MTAVRERGRALARVGTLSPVARLLVGSQLLFNVGFYLVVPYLAGHLANDLGLAGWLVGLVLGLRTFSQQGLFVLGGTLTDRFGPKPVVLAGCAVRVAGFAVLAAATSLPGVLGGVVLVGLAGALFSPAVESSLAREAGPDGRADAFSVFAVCGEIGAVAGPLLGVVLAGQFRVACVAGAALFIGIGLLHLRFLPRLPGEHRDEPVLDGWREVLGNRVFLVFAAGYSAYLVSYNQLYLALPAELNRVGADDRMLGLLFALASTLIILGQLPVSALSRKLLGRTGALVGGFVLIGLAFAVVALRPPGVTGAVAFVVLLIFGQMLVVPRAKELVPVLAGERRLGTYFGVLASAGGVAVLVGSTAGGALLEHGRVAWVVLALLPMAGACVLAALARRAW